MNQISEHKHYGALEVMTWTTAGFDHHAIRGSLLDLRRLASFVEAKLADARQAGQFQFEKSLRPTALIPSRWRFATMNLTPLKGVTDE